MTRNDSEGCAGLILGLLLFALIIAITAHGCHTAENTGKIEKTLKRIEAQLQSKKMTMILDARHTLIVSSRDLDAKKIMRAAKGHNPRLDADVERLMDELEPETLISDFTAAWTPTTRTYTNGIKGIWPASYSGWD